MRRVLVPVLVSCAMGALGVFVVAQVLNLLGEGRQALRVSCIVLANAIIESGASGQMDPTTPQAKLQGLYVQALVRHMTPGERLQANELQAQVVAGGGAVKVPPCEQIARDPDSVRLKQLPRPRSAGP